MLVQEMPAKETPVQEIAVDGCVNETKIRILDTAMELFALKGFDAVSMKDIAKIVGIKTASIYYHYESKNALTEEVLSHFERVYKQHFTWLSGVNEKAESLEELMDNLFNEEFLGRLSPIMSRGISLTLKEQHNNEAACKCVFKLLHDEGIKHIQADLDRLIAKGVIPPSDTKTLATLFILCLMSSNDVLVHEHAGTKTPIDYSETYCGLKKLLTATLAQGTLQN